MNELSPYEEAIIRRAGFYGSHSAWRPARYTSGVIIVPGNSPDTATGELRLIATDGNLGAFIATGNSGCYYLGHIKHFTGKPKATPSSKPKTARGSRAKPKAKPSKARAAAVRRQMILDLL